LKGYRIKLFPGKKILDLGRKREKTAITLGKKLKSAQIVNTAWREQDLLLTSGPCHFALQKDYCEKPKRGKTTL